jgi:hypothetical protein
VLTKLKGSLYRLVRKASEDAVRDGIDARVVPEIGDSKRLLAEYIDVRVADLDRESAVARDRAIEQGTTIDQVATLQRESMAYVAEELRRVSDALAHLDAGRLTAPAIITRLFKGEAGVVDRDVADLINAANSSVGTLARAGLFFNLAPWVTWHPDGPRLEGVNERIAEIPFVLQAVADMPVGSRILDVGSAESTVPASLATIGHDVTALDPRGYPLPHPGLTVETCRFDDLSAADRRPYDAVISLSSIEHFGLASYPGDRVEPSADRDAVLHARELLAEGGRLILTLPFGEPRITELERVYGHDELAALLEGFEIVEQVILHRRDATTWLLGEDTERDGCVMLVARPA